MGVTIRPTSAGPRARAGESPPTVADGVCSQLVAHGVSVLFGHPGGAILPFYDALHRAPALRHILMRHEQAAAHAADGYARATGRTGVCVATSGPGATNLVTGLATAYADGVPMVALTGQVPTFGRGQDFFQEADILGITMPVTKHGFSLEGPEDLMAVLDEAFALAARGRPGPVLVDIPKDIQSLPMSDAIGSTVRPAARAVGHPNGITDAATLINGSSRPLIMAGRGVVVSETTNALLRLAERADIPVVTTLLGLDGFPRGHRLALGMPGMHGTVRANRAIQEADVILGVGLRFDDRVTGRTDRFAPRAQIIHADINPGALGRTIRPAVEICGDLRDTLPRLEAGIDTATRTAWLDHVRDLEPEAPVLTDVPADRLTGRAACRALARAIARDGAAVATDVGQHQMWLAQELGDARPGTHLTSGGLGTMGYALPAALGSAVGRPERVTWAVAGDGGFQMTMQELATVTQERIPLRIAVVNNGYLGMVRQWQELYHGHRYSASALSGPDLVRLADAFGIPARRASTPEALAQAIEWSRTLVGPMLIDVQVRAEDNVFPMVPPGAALDEVIPEPEPAAS